MNLEGNFIMKRKLVYIEVFIVTIVILVLAQAVSISIPNKFIKNNMIESAQYYNQQSKHSYLFNSFDINNEAKISMFAIDNYTDSLTLNMIWNAKLTSNNPFESLVLMKYYRNDELYMTESLYETVINGEEANTEYSRYWHGSIIYIKPLLIFFNIKGIRIVNVLVMLSLIVYLSFLLFKKNKILSISLLIGLVMVMIPTTMICLEYFFAFVIMLIASIATVRNIDKEDKEFYKIMVVSGVSVCFFDFLTCETITLGVPLLIRLVLKNKFDNKKEVFKFVFYSMLAWLVSYSITFMGKWLLSIIVLGIEQFGNIWEKAAVRIYNIPENNIFSYLSLFLFVPTILFPFGLNNSGSIFFIIFCLFIFWIFIMFIKDKKKYGWLLLCCLPGILRLIVLHAHTMGHYFFDYRALLPLVIVMIMILIEGVGNEINNINTLFKRGRNDRKSNKDSKKVYKKKKVN